MNLATLESQTGNKVQAEIYLREAARIRPPVKPR
jgi:hypothetical protein